MFDLVEHFSILFLHSSQSYAEQQKIFKPVPSGIRKLRLLLFIQHNSI